MTDEEVMRLAIAEAKQTTDDVPVGAVVVKNEQVIAVAHNTRELLNNPIAHAEMLVMQKAAQVIGNRRLTGCTLYVTLEPCPMCAGAMMMAGLSKCVFGAYDVQYGCCGSLYHLPMDPAFPHRVPCVGGVLQQECEALLASFFALKRL